MNNNHINIENNPYMSNSDKGILPSGLDMSYGNYCSSQGLCTAFNKNCEINSHDNNVCHKCNSHVNFKKCLNCNLKFCLYCINNNDTLYPYKCPICFSSIDFANIN